MKKILVASVMFLLIAGTISIQASDLSTRIKQMQNIQELTKQNDAKTAFHQRSGEVPGDQ